jgi:lipopolysaccharide export system protein LptA
MVDMACAQEKTKLEIINANYSYYDAEKFPGVRRLVDSVIFQHKGATLFCDSAWQYINENRFEAFGDIHLNQGDSLHIYGKHLEYLGEKNQIILEKEVLLKDDEMRMLTDRLYYDLDSEKASYYQGATIYNANDTLSSQKGYFFSTTNRFLFKDEVVLLSPTYNIKSDTLAYQTDSEISYFFGPTTIDSDANTIYCENGWYDNNKDISRFSKNAVLWSAHQKLEADSLYYDRNNGYGLAYKQVLMTDTLNDFTLAGEQAEYFELIDSCIITQTPLLTLLRDEDSLFLHADTITVASRPQEGMERRILKAFTGVKFYSESFQGSCKRLHFHTADSIIYMIDDPLLWMEDYQLSSEDILFQLTEDAISDMWLKDNAFISSLGHEEVYNQIKGKLMHGFFKNNELKHIDVVGNGQAVYVIKDEEDKVSGVNTITCSSMDIYLKDEDFQRINFKEAPDATLFPYKDLPQEWKQLKGFLWKEAERPLKKSDIFE